MKLVHTLVFALALLSIGLFGSTGCDPSCDVNGDCDDGDPCNGIDGVCLDGLCSITLVPECCERDSDCDDLRFCNGNEECDYGRCAPAEFTCIGDNYVCDEGMKICRCEEPDADRDGAYSVQCGGTDCDDDEARRYPGAAEACDAADRDEDCDTATFGSRDLDGDGHTDTACANVSAAGEITGGTDCDDTRAGTHPGVPESCNEIDDDCDGAIDESALVASYVDQDGDGYGEGDFELLCAGLAGYSNRGGDCDDTLSQVHPGAFRCLSGGAEFEIELCDDDGAWGPTDECPSEGVCVPQPDGAGVCLMGEQQTFQCSDGADNDRDGLSDWASDPECASPLDNSEGPRACGDGQDNDDDNAFDFPNDPGCTSLEDGSENDPATAPTCANGLDDDGDGTIDYLDGTGDPGCVASGDTSERETTGPACDNGVDDDKDTLSDFPDDIACTSSNADDETAVCNNGLDDDRDGNIDLNDTGCVNANDTSERLGVNSVECDNGLDDDGDGAADYPGDLGCTSAEDGKE